MAAKATAPRIEPIRLAPLKPGPFHVEDALARVGGVAVAEDDAEQEQVGRGEHERASDNQQPALPTARNLKPAHSISNGINVKAKPDTKPAMLPTVMLPSTKPPTRCAHQRGITATANA